MKLPEKLGKKRTKEWEFKELSNQGSQLLSSLLKRLRSFFQLIWFMNSANMLLLLNATTSGEVNSSENAAAFLARQIFQVVNFTSPTKFCFLKVLFFPVSFDDFSPREQYTRRTKRPRSAGFWRYTNSWKSSWKLKLHFWLLGYF